MTKNAGPGKSYRKGVTLMEAVKMFDTEEKAEAWFVARRWPDGVACPHCGSTNIADIASRKPQPYRCRDCRKHFSVKTGTLLHSSNIPLSKWAIAFYLFSTSLKGVSSMKLHRDLGIGQKAAWYMGHRIRSTWGEPEELFAGPVEADETYIGGKEKNKHEWKKQKAGRGTVGKTPVAGVKDRPTNTITTVVVERTDRPTLQGFVLEHSEEGAQVYTDEATAYKGIDRPHEAVAHSANEYVRDMAHTNGMESHWALMKRGIDGIYHHVSVKHLGRYANEFSGRHNNRPFDTLDQMTEMARGIRNGRLRYEDLIAG
jgi:transposase-like protein